MDGRAWWAAVYGVAKSRTRLSDFIFTFHFHALEKEMETHSSVLAWRIPGTGEPGGLPSMGSHKVGHNWSDLAAAAAAQNDYMWGISAQFVMYVLSTDHSLWPRLPTKLFLKYIKDVNKHLFWHRQLLSMAMASPFPSHDCFCPHYEHGDCCLCDKLPAMDLIFWFIFCLVSRSTDSSTYSLFNT